MALAGGKFSVNGTAYDPPSVPVLLQIMSGARDPKDLLPAGSVYSLPRNKVVEVTFPGLNAAGPVSHPLASMRGLQLTSISLASFPYAWGEYIS
jgi:hypothetical protein